jgi:antitoxin PrlF
VVIRKVIAEDEDPALDGFVDLLERDISRHKDQVIFATEGFANHLQELTVGIEVDYNAPIEGDFQL